nr:zinc finger, CCHC-type [Tanacetum cinerariifolium]
MACSLPHTIDEIQTLVKKLIDEYIIHQKAFMEIAVQFDNASAAKNDMRKAYEKCNDISQKSRALIDTFFKQESDKDYKQPTVALSSCESEFMAATGAACQALWLKRLLSEITGWEEERITLKVDNISAIALVRNPFFHGRSKHIDIRYHFICECIENGHINMEHIGGELQRADILTKALPRLKFVTMRQMLGVQDLGRSNDQN